MHKQPADNFCILSSEGKYAQESALSLVFAK